jgi:ADP-heptose:LPS heptosyltransferase
MTMMNDWNGAASLLCVQFGTHGDLLACTPALRALRAQCPGRRVTLLTSPAGAALGPYLPDVDAVLAYEAPWLDSKACAAHLDSIATLAAQGFDGAVIFTRHNESALPAALLCQLAGIPLRAAWCREKPYQLLTHPIADPEPGAMLRHPVQRHLDLVGRLGADIADERLAFLPSPGDMAAVRARLVAIGIDPARRWMVVHPGAGAMARGYPQDAWSALLCALHAGIGCPLVLTGGVHEQTLIEAIGSAASVPVLSFAGKLDIGERGALLAQASTVISSSAGTIDLAAAVGTPAVALHALTHAQHTPWRVSARMVGLAGPAAGKPALAPVLDAVRSLLRQTEPQGRPMNRYSDECPPRAWP